MAGEVPLPVRRQVAHGHPVCQPHGQRAGALPRGAGADALATLPDGGGGLGAAAVARRRSLRPVAAVEEEKIRKPRSGSGLRGECNKKQSALKGGTKGA